MRDTNPDLFPALKDAQTLQGLYFEVCPGVKRWQTQTIQQADDQGFLRNPFGYVHRFWQVQTWKKTIIGTWEAEWGEDAKRVLAFLPQSTAAGIIKEALLRLDQRAMRPFLRLQVHDSLVNEAPEGAFAWMAASTIACMEEPIREMELPWDPGSHLVIETESKHGTCWGKMEAWG
jgi:DNA polymerase I-like protein with 3'-5' exonuclease and polymerase domains